MFSPSASISQSFPSCSTLYFQDTTCTYNTTVCPCGYNSPNIAKSSVTTTGLTLISPLGQVYYISGAYLPTSLTPLAISCTTLSTNQQNYLIVSGLTNQILDGYTMTGVTSGASATILSINGTAIVYSYTNTNLFQTNETINFYFNGNLEATATILQTGVTPQNTSPVEGGGCSTCTPPQSPSQGAGNCFTDGCWQFQYDVFALVNSNYSWTITPSQQYFSITVNSISYNNNFTTTPTIAQVTTWLNTLGFAAFYSSGSTISVNDPNNVYGNILQWSAIPTTIVTSGITGTSVFVSVVINSTLYIVGNNVTSTTDLATQLTNLGLGTFTPSGANISIPSGLFIGNADDFSFSGTGTFVVALTGGTVTTTTTPTILQSNQVAGTYIWEQFLSCNITNQLNQFLLQQFGTNCLSCTDTIKQDMWNLIVQYQVMLIAIGNCSGGCVSATPYLNVLQASLTSLQNQC